MSYLLVCHKTVVYILIAYLFSISFDPVNVNCHDISLISFFLFFPFLFLFLSLSVSMQYQFNLINSHAIVISIPLRLKHQIDFHWKWAAPTAIHEKQFLSNACRLNCWSELRLQQKTTQILCCQIVFTNEKKTFSEKPLSKDVFFCLGV